MAMARGPARPSLERHLVRVAVANVAPPQAPRDPLARDLARRVVEELTAFLAEPDDPLLSVIGEMNRKVFPSPVVALATDPDIDTLALFVDARAEALRSRSGRGLTPGDDAAERRAIMGVVEKRLARRYLRHLRE
ncbi:hypothetical protein [Sphingomonas sp.]|uniref:hypothetical protein n=1 Tax=Sphingomonas sp. TaxID=28214 RepID=UPI002DD68886|nr:hypothetical protein [Sphingomonas sp.]